MWTSKNEETKGLKILFIIVIIIYIIYILLYYIFIHMADGMMDHQSIHDHGPLGVTSIRTLEAPSMQGLWYTMPPEAYIHSMDGSYSSSSTN